MRRRLLAVSCAPRLTVSARNWQPRTKQNVLMRVRLPFVIACAKLILKRTAKPMRRYGDGAPAIH